MQRTLAFIIVLSIGIQVYAADIWTNLNSYVPNSTITISYKNFQRSNDDWVGVYPYGSSNDGGNVVSWA